MQKLGIAAGKGQKQPRESMVEYSEKALAADDYQAEGQSSNKPESEFFTSLKPKKVAAILKGGEQPADTEEEGGLENGSQG